LDDGDRPPRVSRMALDGQRTKNLRSLFIRVVAASWCSSRRLAASQRWSILRRPGASGDSDLGRGKREEREHPAAWTIGVIRITSASGCEATGSFAQRRVAGARVGAIGANIEAGGLLDSLRYHSFEARGLFGRSRLSRWPCRTSSSRDRRSRLPSRRFAGCSQRRALRGRFVRDGLIRAAV